MILKSCMSSGIKELYEFNDFVLDVGERVLRRGGEHIPLSEKTFETLSVLIRRAGHLVTKDEMMQLVWPDSFVEENNLDKNISLLRQALGEKKGEIRFIRTVRGQGYRFVAAVSRGGAEPVPELEFQRRHAPSDIETGGVGPAQKDPNPFGKKERATRIGVIAAVATALSLLIIGAYYFYFTRGNGPNEVLKGSAVRSIAVLPFENATQDPDAKYLSDGISESLINRLSQISNFTVMSRSSAARYKGSELDAQEIGDELGVQAVLSGSVNLVGDQLVVTIRLDDARDGRHIWGDQYVRKFADILEMQSEIAQEVTSQLRIRLSGAEREQLAKNYTQNAEAYQLYLKGVYFWNKYPAKEYEKSREYYEQAIDIDPKYALAYSGLSDYYGYAANNGSVLPADNWSKAEAAAEKALAIDDSLSEAHNSLAAVKMYFYRDWDSAEREFKRAIETDPKNTEAHQLYGGFLIIRGRPQAGIAEKRIAIDVEPLSLRLNRQLGRALYWIRDFDGAIDQYRKTLELDSNDAYTHELLGNAYEKKQMQKEAIAEWSKALRLNEEVQMADMLDRVSAGSGFDAAVRSLWSKRIEEFTQKSATGRYIPAMNFATAYAHLRDKENAFKWLTKAELERNRLIFDLKLEPIFDEWKTDPRFAQLLARVGPTAG
ncbi:MAG: winged helix-turn-helix domain-containing protein [Pyrinomonadaceae bacterium]